MTGANKYDIEQREPALDEKLDLFESEWKSGSAPDIRRYLSAPHASDTTYRVTLVQRDLEYRWRRYADAETRSRVEEHDFPCFPMLEDYAVRAGVPAGELFTPEMIATEYRVRAKWGDRPDRTVFFARFPEMAADLTAVLEQVDRELAADPSSSGTPVDEMSVHSTVDQGRAERRRSDLSASVAGVPTQLDRYQLQSLLGSGGFGEVWKAYDPALKRHVAIKILRRDRGVVPEIIAEFAEEGRKLARLGPIPGIVTVFDAGDDAGRGYIVMELIEGDCLATLLKTRRFSHMESAALIAEAASALQQAHRKGIVHRDVKPSNILVRDGSPILADFGLSVTEQDQLLEARRTVGTIAYMPPEQAEGNSHLANPQADVYSLGVILYRLLTNRLPFVANTVAEYLKQMHERDPWPPRSIDDTIPPELEQICLKCMAKTPADRFSTAKDLAEALQRFLASRLPENSLPPKRRRAPAAALLAASLLAIVIVGALLILAARRGGDAGKSGVPIPEPPEGAEKTAMNEWVAHLGQPRDIFFPGHSGRGHFGFDENEPPALTVSTDAVRLIRFGEMTESSFTLSVDIRLLEWRGLTGLFFGYQEKERDGEPGAEFQLFCLHRSSDGTIIVTRRKARVSQDRKGIASDLDIQSQRVTTWKRQPRLEIRVEKGRMKSIKLDDTSLFRLMTPANKHFPADSFLGPWGGFTQEGTTWFIKPDLTIGEPSR